MWRRWRQPARIGAAPYGPTDHEIRVRHEAVEWGPSKVNAPAVWAQGDFGQGALVAGADTGYQWNHPALINQYAGWNGAAADHAYHWHDAIHEAMSGGSNPCGYDSPAPCDDDSHGTHTMGTMVGDDGLGNQIGIAPQARWIGCRNMERGIGSPATYIECFEWFIAPTDANGENPDPGRAPDVIGNSWSCPGSEGCNTTTIPLLEEAVDATHAAGILVVVAAGNSGPGCGTASGAPASFANALTVGATASNDGIASFSSRGPTLTGLLKPDVVAPGVGVRSSVPYSAYATFQGTSMATPHVAGVAALVLTANPYLKRQPDQLAFMLMQTAVPIASTQNCGAYPGAQIPNAVYGHGRVDASAAYTLAIPIFADAFE
jgi:subtilisin family serine protease